MDAGVEKDLVLGDPTAPRYVFWENKLRATPSGPDILTFDLLSIIGKIRAGFGAIGLFNRPPPGAWHTMHHTRTSTWHMHHIGTWHMMYMAHANAPRTR